MVFLKFITCNNLYSYGNEDHVIPLHENTIIAGPNNSGKSNILRMLRLLIRSLKNGYNLQDYEMFDPNVDSYLELRLNLSYEEAKKIADFFSFYAEKHGTGNNKFYTFGDKKSLVNILKQLKIRITWQQQLYKVDRKAKVSFEFENIGLFLFGQTLSFELTAINALDKEQELQKEMADTRIQDVLEAASMSSIPDAKVRNIFESHADQFLKTDVLRAAKNTDLEEIPTRILRDLFVYTVGYMEPNRDVGFTGIIASILDKKILFASESRVTNQSVFDCVESLEMREGGQDSPNERSEKQSFNDKLQKQAVKQSLEYTNTLDQNGKNLSQFLFSIRNSSYDGDRAKYDYIKSAFERIFEESGISIDIIVEYVDPTLHTVYYRQTGQTPKYPKIMVTESLTNKRFPIDSVGAGIKETLYLLACAFGTSDAVLVLDEPSTNLHPTMMKNVMNLLEEDQGNQIVVITHSPELTIHELFDKKSFPLYVSKNNGYSEVKHMDTKTSKWFTKNIPVLKYTIDPRIFFSRKVVLTEGESDRYLIGISQLIELKYPQLNLSSKDILVLGVGGKTNFKKYIKLLRVFGIKYMILADKDALKDVFKNQSYSEISSERISGDGPLFIIQEGNLENLMQKMDNESYIQAQAEHGPSKPALGYSFIEKAYIKNEQTFEPIVKLLEKITKD